MELLDFKKWLKAEGDMVNRILKEEVNLIPKPARPVISHILEAGGKRLRPLLTLLFARLFGNNDKNIYRLASSMEMLHAATLLHDDVLDSAESRRGKPSAHIVFNPASAILGGDALLARGNAIVASFNNPALVECFSLATVQTAAGEIHEMDSLYNPDLALETYIEIARGKTACLIAQSCRMGALYAGADREMADKSASFGENLGIAFQIVDDALDLSPEQQTGKPRGGDLREGKMTPPLFFYRQSLSDKQREEFDSAFSGKGFSSSQIEEICSLSAPFTTRALALADTYLLNASLSLETFPANSHKDILTQIMDYVRSRRS